MKRVLLISAIGVALVATLFAGLVLGVLVTPARAQIGQAIGQVLRHANVNMRAPLVAAQQAAQGQLKLKDEKGVLVAGVFVDSPADKAGLKRGDIILDIDGQAVNTMKDLRGVLSSHKAGDTLKLSVQHGDTHNTISVTLAEPPVQAQPSTNGAQSATPAPGQNEQNTKPHKLSSLPFLGIVPSGVNGEKGWFGSKPGMHGDQGNGAQPFHMVNGAPIVEVTSGSPAEKAGLKAGDVVLSVDGTAVDAQNTLPALITSHKPGDSVKIEVQSSGGDKREVTVTLGDNPNKAGSAWLGVAIGMNGPQRFHQGGNGDQPFGPGNPNPGLPNPNTTPGAPNGANPGMPGLTMHPGAVIEEVTSGSPAEKAGLKAGQFIQSVDGVELKSPDDLVKTVSSHKPGDTITLTVFAPGSTTASSDVKVTLGENPQKAGAAWLGIRFSYIEVQPGQQPGTDTLQQG